MCEIVILNGVFEMCCERERDRVREIDIDNISNIYGDLYQICLQWSRQIFSHAFSY